MFDGVRNGGRKKAEFVGGEEPRRSDSHHGGSRRVGETVLVLVIGGIAELG